MAEQPKKATSRKRARRRKLRRADIARMSDHEFVQRRSEVEALLADQREFTGDDGADGTGRR